MSAVPGDPYIVILYDVLLNYGLSSIDSSALFICELVDISLRDEAIIPGNMRGDFCCPDG